MATTYFHHESYAQALAGLEPDADEAQLAELPRISRTAGRYDTPIFNCDGLSVAVVSDPGMLAWASRDLLQAMADSDAASGVIVMPSRSRLINIEPTVSQLADLGVSFHPSPIADLLEAAQNYIHQYWENRRVVRENLLKFEYAHA